MGVAVIAEPNAILVSSLHLVRDIVGNHSYIIGFFLLVVGISAMHAHVPKSLKWAYVWTAPQQFMLSLQFWSVLFPIFIGHYPDGYTPVGDGGFIFVDQLPVLTLTLAPIVDAIATALSRGKFYDG